MIGLILILFLFSKYIYIYVIFKIYNKYYNKTRVKDKLTK